MILPHDTDPTPVGELVAAWVGAKLAEVDDLVGTGLETINDKSSRWTLPLVGGARSAPTGMPNGVTFSDVTSTFSTMRTPLERAPLA